MSTNSAPQVPEAQQDCPSENGDVVRVGEIFKTFINEAIAIGRELDARRRFDNDVSAFLTEFGLDRDFVAWRKAKAGAPDQDAT